MTLPWLIRVPDPLQGAYPTSAPLRHPRNRMQTHGFSSPEKGAACPTPEMKRKAGNWPFSWNFSSCYFPGEKKRFWSNLGFFLLQIRTIDSSQSEVIWTQPLSVKHFPKDSAIWSCFASTVYRSLAWATGPWYPHSLTVFLSPSPTPRILISAFSSDRKTLMWFLIISPLFNHSSEIGPKIENQRGTVCNEL